VLGEEKADLGKLLRANLFYVLYYKVEALLQDLRVIIMETQQEVEQMIGLRRRIQRLLKK